MVPKLILLLTILLIFVFSSCTTSELSWSMNETSPDSMRQLLGLPSVAVGNLNPSARNPGLEFLCTGFYDVPGGYCNYFSMGTPFTDLSIPKNFEITNSTKGVK